MTRDLVEAIRRPEYTGENRCLACTVVNLLIATVVGAVLSKKSKPAGLFAVAGSIVLIYVRGYLIPGTPGLTKRYLPPTVLEWFGKGPEADLATGLEAPPPSAMDEDRSSEEPDESGTATVSDDLEAYFLEAGILEPCEDRNDLCLTAGFEHEWLEAIESVVDSRMDTEKAIKAFGIDDPDGFELEAKENGAYALQYGTDEIGEGPRYNAGMWPSYAALVADIAASRLLGSWLEEWDEYEPGAKGQLLGSLRMFLETCPTAEGGVETTQETVESCCGSEEVFAVVCEETGDRLFEHQIPS